MKLLLCIDCSDVRALRVSNGRAAPAGLRAVLMQADDDAIVRTMACNHRRQTGQLRMVRNANAVRVRLIQRRPGRLPHHAPAVVPRGRPDPERM